MQVRVLPGSLLNFRTEGTCKCAQCIWSAIQKTSPLWGSNPRPYAYEAHALPAELRRLTQLALSENHGILPDDPANMGCFELGTSNRLHFLLAWLAFTGRHGLARRTRGCCKLCPNIKPNTFRPSRFWGGGIVFFHCFLALSGFG